MQRRWARASEARAGVLQVKAVRTTATNSERKGISTTATADGQSASAAAG
jgi:hypothetical protein